MEELTTADCLSIGSEVDDDDLCRGHGCQETDGRYFAKPHIFVRPSTENHHAPNHAGDGTTPSGAECAPLQATPPSPPPPPLPVETRPTLRHTFQQPFGNPFSSPVDRQIYASLPAYRPGEHGGILTTAVSALVACLLAVATFAIAYYYAGFSTPVASAIALLAVWIPVTFALCASIACR